MKTPNQSAVFPDRHRNESIVRADCILLGDIISKGTVIVDGTVDGDIDSLVLIVGARGSVTGRVRAKTVRVYGTLKGHVTANLLHVFNSARIAARMIYDGISIEFGADVEGRLLRLAASSASAPTASDTVGAARAIFRGVARTVGPVPSSRPDASSVTAAVAEN